MVGYIRSVIIVCISRDGDTAWHPGRISYWNQEYRESRREEKADRAFLRAANCAPPSTPHHSSLRPSDISEQLLLSTSRRTHDPTSAITPVTRPADGRGSGCRCFTCSLHINDLDPTYCITIVQKLFHYSTKLWHWSTRSHSYTLDTSRNGESCVHWNNEYPIDLFYFFLL